MSCGSFVFGGEKAWEVLILLGRCVGVFIANYAMGVLKKREMGKFIGRS
jgi:hypothetical protein